MLKKLFLFTLLLVTGINVLPASLQLGKINLQNVEKYQEEIAYKFKRGSLVKKAALGSALVAIAYLTYRMNTLDSSVSAPAAPKLDLTLEEKKEELMNKVIELCKKNGAISKATEENANTIKRLLEDNGYYVSGTKLGWGQWASGWGNWFARMFTLSFVGSVASLSISPIMKYFKAFDAAVDKGVNRIFPYASIDWYLTTHANLPMVFNDLKREANKLDKQNDLSQTVEFEASWNLLVNQIERVLGYISYRNELFGPLLKERGAQISANLATLVNQKVDCIAINQPQSYVDWIGDLRTAMDDELHAFLEIEHIDRA